MPDDARALDALNKAILVNPDNADLLYARASLLRGMERDDVAMRDLNRIIKIFPRHYAAYVQRGELYQRRGENERALVDFNHAISLGGGDNGLVYKLKGAALASLKRLPEAEAALSKALEVNKNYDAIYYDRAKLYCSDGKYDKAVADYTYYLRLKPNDPRALSGRALAYEKLGKTELARKDRLAADSNELTRAVDATQRTLSKFDQLNNTLQKIEGVDRAKQYTLKHQPAK